MEAKRRPAVFLDRDGTLIEHVHFLTDPAGVRILPGATAALRRLRQAGFASVLVTNQSGVGRGLLTEARLHEIHEEMNRRLAEDDCSLDAIYYCPDAPNDQIHNPRRKPAPGMLLEAAADLGLDLEASWMIGDLITDVLTGLNAGCRSILVGSGPTPPSESDVARWSGHYLTVSDFANAVGLILRTVREESRPTTVSVSAHLPQSSS